MPEPKDAKEQSFSEKIDKMTLEEKAKFLTDLWKRSRRCANTIQDKFFDKPGELDKYEPDQELFYRLHSLGKNEGRHEVFQEISYDLDSLDEGVVYEYKDDADEGTPVQVTPEIFSRVWSRIEQDLNNLNNEDWTIIKKSAKRVEELEEQFK